jgi:ankyrin repeat protein
MAEHVDVVRVLVDAGANADLQDRNRNNPLLLCGENGNVELLREVLAAKPNLRATNRFGGSALIPASDRDHVDMVRALLETDVPIDHVNRLGWTALLEAVVLGDGGPAHQRIVRLLVDAGADTAIADKDGVTALEHARVRVRGNRAHPRAHLGAGELGVDRRGAAVGVDEEHQHREAACTLISA